MTGDVFNPVMRVDCRRIKDEESFHEVFAEAFGFPGFYGRNWDAWIDCMTSLDQPEDGMSAYNIPVGSVLTLHLDHFGGMRPTSPAIWQALIDCAALVNYRRIKVGELPILALSYWEHEPK